MCLGVGRTRGQGLSFFLKNAVLALELRLGLGLVSTLTLTLKQHSLKKIRIDPDLRPEHDTRFTDTLCLIVGN